MIGASIMLLWATPHSLNEENIAFIHNNIVSLILQDITNTIKYTLPGSRQNAVLGGLHPGVTYQVQLMTETSSGHQPFYSPNVTTLTGVSEMVWSSVGCAGVMLVIVLVVCGVPGVVCCIVWRMRSRTGEMNERVC